MRAPTEEPAIRESVLVTGYPAFTARRFITKILEEDDDANVFVLVRDKFASAARDTIADLPESSASRTEIIIGDVCDMDLGLSGREYQVLAQEITTIQHMAGIYYMGVDERTARRVNVEGTRGVLELAAEAKRLRRLCHWSTAAVAGKRKGAAPEAQQLARCGRWG